MNQKDYKAIADVIKSVKIRRDNIDSVVYDLADYFEEEYKKDLERTEERFKAYKKKNESFERKKFLKECGVE